MSIARILFAYVVILTMGVANADTTDDMINAYRAKLGFIITLDQVWDQIKAQGLNTECIEIAFNKLGAYQAYSAHVIYEYELCMQERNN